MESNLSIIKLFEQLKGQIVSCMDDNFRLLGICKDIEDYYYILTKKNQCFLVSCTTEISGVNESEESFPDIYTSKQQEIEDENILTSLGEHELVVYYTDEL